ncbi:hypothetical protein [Haloarcula onubensis]|uniref:Uncharacterized protein n=1 Tax=Haloarcula onubensis TaxID=2950539 RepID=A0ABU2FVI1_9EURY|nr:hypothetical protein [Halomicroarcula sp. S3CR25-11]MDS0284769.1 hypothetical protein [Halomicroarcula sp. S3CR25-11]
MLPIGRVVPGRFDYLFPERVGLAAEWVTVLQLVEDMDQIPADKFDGALRKATKEGLVQDTPQGIEPL